MKQLIQLGLYLLIAALFAILTGCALFNSPKTPLQSTPGNEADASVGTNGVFNFHILDQQNSTYSNLSVAVSNGTASFNASGVTHTMDPGVITMSGKAYLDLQNAQYAAQQAMLAQVIAAVGTAAATGGVAAKAPVSQNEVMIHMLNMITSLEAQMPKATTNSPTKP